MIGSLFAGISGLNVSSTAMTVIGDNIANVNTTAFKSNKASFANILSESLGGASGNSIGRGVQFWGTTPAWSQGSIENTTNATDMAINGKGFFMLEDASGGDYYTRAGEFSFDKDGNLVNPDGLYVQGYDITTVNPDGSVVLGPISTINVPGESTSPPQPTDILTMDVNLDAGAVATDTYTSSITVYDSLGNAIPLSITFTKNAAPPNSWTAGVSVPAGTVGNPATDIGITNATISFNGSGVLNNGVDPSITLTNLVSGAANVTINWDLFDAAGATNGDVTQYAAASTTVFQTQNGFTSGNLRGVSVDEAGFVTGIYSNGQRTPLFQVALADFPSYYGLAKMGNNLYAESRASGQAMPGVPQSGSLGGISPSAIEMSNVDLAQEFVKMITTQRAFQANSRVITTSDEILQELINLKR
ncbi:MAG: flagellar hook protein FlgE [Desulfobacterales bacterium]|nr:flagellar hook protein FlgE [Desulfobacterales bacterium]